MNGRLNDPLAPIGENSQLSRWGAAQASVIGSMLTDERCCGDVFQHTSPEMFSDATLRHIYEACRKVWFERRQIDPVIVLNECGSDSYAATIGDCMRITPTAANVLEYCKLLSDCLRLQTFREAAYDLLGAMDAQAAGEIWNRLGRQLMSGKKKSIYSYRQLLDDFFDRLNDPAPPDYIDWGFEPLNKVMTVKAGHFVVIGAESSTGKTALAFQLARHFAEAGKKVGFFSLETPKEDAEDRLLANAGGVSLYAIKYKRVQDAEMKRLTQHAERTYDVSFDLIEAAGYTLEDIEEDTIANGYDTVFVDYVQMVNALKASDDVSLQVRTVSLGLHIMSMRLGCTVIALSQVTPPPRDKYGKRRYLSMWDLRESKQLVQDAQAIMMLDLTDPDDRRSPRVMIVDKNKDGECGRMFLEFDAPRMRFTYLPGYEDPNEAAARERNEKMDRNREARQEKERRLKGIDGQIDFHELEDNAGGELPFGMN